MDGREERRENGRGGGAKEPSEILHFLDGKR